MRTLGNCSLNASTVMSRPIFISLNSVPSLVNRALSWTHAGQLSFVYTVVVFKYPVIVFKYKVGRYALPRELPEVPPQFNYMRIEPILQT